MTGAAMDVQMAAVALGKACGAVLGELGRWAGN